ncbi:MAG: alpha/beta hydrolase [Bacteroidetes bacterium]|nr:alpha/beta hydrolase [Bacteroidota bacterium]
MKYLILFIICFLTTTASGQSLWDRVEHGFADNEGVKIHYVKTGSGPVILLLHGFPDFWYTWRRQMEALAPRFTVVAMDLRGYNQSDKPKEVEDYAMRHLVADVGAVIDRLGVPKVILVGHDWGGAIAWQVAINRPELVEKLVILSTPHPRGLLRELQNNKQQQSGSTYAEDFQKKDAHKNLTPEEMVSWVKDEDAKPRYLEAFRKSSIEGMLNYYKASFPKSRTKSSSPTRPLKKVQCPTLVFFGLEDKALLAAGFNSTWEWVDAPLTMISIPGVGHFVQQDASEMVTSNLMRWLD